MKAVAVLEPMMPTLAPLPRGDEWIYEPRWDGWRAITHLDGAGSIRIDSRKGRDLTASVPEVHPLGEALTWPAIVDGQLIAFDRTRHVSFYALRGRMGATRSQSLGVVCRRAPAAYVIFDLLALNGEDLTVRPWQERRALLDALDLNGPAWACCPASSDVRDELADICDPFGIEGVVAKRLDSRYVPGIRTESWIESRRPHWVRHHAR